MLSLIEDKHEQWQTRHPGAKLRLQSVPKENLFHKIFLGHFAHIENRTTLKRMSTVSIIIGHKKA